jgi:hypothetical protein
MQKRDTYSQIMAVLLHLPWPIDLGLGVFFFILFDGLSHTFGAAASVDPSGLREFIAQLSGILAFALPAVLAASAVGSLLRRGRPKT